MKLADLQIICINRTDQLYHKYIKLPAPSAKLQEAVSYAVFNGGKRVRPLLVYATGLALGAEIENLDAAAAAIELIHAYSLIHDDLPAMDDADFRRGKPACHKVFGEGVAILAGDALQTLAFQIIATHSCSLNSEQKLQMIGILSEASGLAGMAGGQALDIAEKITRVEDLTELYRLKTGALLSAAVKLGIAGANQKNNPALEKFAECIGFAFQIQDDVLDIESDATGKPQGIDVINEKVTYPALVGIEKSRLKVKELIESAFSLIADLGPEGKILHELAHYLLQRKQ